MLHGSHILRDKPLQAHERLVEAVVVQVGRWWRHAPYDARRGEIAALGKTMCSSGRVRSACVERGVVQWPTLARRWRIIGELGLPCVAERMHPRQQDDVFFIQFHAAEHLVPVPLGGDVLCRARATRVPRVDS